MVRKIAVIVGAINLTGIVLSWGLIVYEPISIVGPIGLFLNAFMLGIWVNTYFEEK